MLRRINPSAATAQTAKVSDAEPVWRKLFHWLIPKRDGQSKSSFGQADTTLPVQMSMRVAVQLLAPVQAASPAFEPTSPVQVLHAANVLNASMGLAYLSTPEHQLAQLAATGTLGGLYKADGDWLADVVRVLACQVDATFLAQAAVYARQQGHMKDMPVLMAALLATRDVQLLDQVFDRVVDNGKTLRKFVALMRSGQTGRRSLGTRPKKLVQRWLLRATEYQLLQASIGASPSLADVVKMVHPKPAEPWRSAWFAWLLGRPFSDDDLPPITRSYVALARMQRKNATKARQMEVPDVPFQMLTDLKLSSGQWAQVARRGSWQMVRQGLNMLARHGVFDDADTLADVAAKLSDPVIIGKARVMPYQLMAAAMATSALPQALQHALDAALEVSLDSVPLLPGATVVALDVSESMRAAVTGQRPSATSVMRCIDVAALVVAALLRKNPQARLLVFNTEVLDAHLDFQDSVFGTARSLARMLCGGTDASAPLEWLNERALPVDTVVMVSDSESWVNRHYLRTSPAQTAWVRLKQFNPQAKMISLDISPSYSTQVKQYGDVLNIGGFTDAVFKVMADFANNPSEAQGACHDHWVEAIRQIPVQLSLPADKLRLTPP